MGQENTYAGRPAISYLRFSTGKQEHGSSTYRQTTAAQEFAQRHGLELIDTYEDRGVSAYKGKNLKDGQLGNLIDAYKRRAISPDTVLIVDDVSRLSRAGTSVVQRTLLDLMELDVTTVFVDGDLWISPETYNTNISQAILLVIGAASANQYSRDQSRRATIWHESREAKLQSGEALPTIGNLAPRYIDKETKKLIPDRAHTVRRIVDHCLEGGSFLAIARKLNEENVPTISGRGIWRQSQIQNLVHSRAIYGAIEYPKGSGSIYPDQFEAVATEEEYEQIQTGLKGRRKNSEKRRKVHTFSGLAKCRLCGSGMYFQRANDNLSYLRCLGQREGNGCSAKNVRYDVLVRMMDMHAQRFNPDDGEHQSASEASLKAQIADAQARRQRTIDRATREEDAAFMDTLFDEAKSIQKEIDTLNDRLRSSRAEPPRGAIRISDEEALRIMEEGSDIGRFYRQVLASMELDTSGGTADTIVYLRQVGHDEEVTIHIGQEEIDETREKQAFKERYLQYVKAIHANKKAEGRN